MSDILDPGDETKLSLKERQKKIRREQYQNAKARFADSDYAKELKAKQKALRKEAYQKMKAKKLALKKQRKEELTLLPPAENESSMAELFVDSNIIDFAAAKIRLRPEVTRDS